MGRDELTGLLVVVAGLLLAIAGSVEEKDMLTCLGLLVAAVGTLRIG